MPFPGNDGGEFSIRNAALALMDQPDLKLKVLAMNTSKDPVDLNEIDPVFRQKCAFETVNIDTKIHYGKLWLNLFSKTSYLAVRFNSKTYRDKLIHILKHEQFDIIQLEHLYLYPYIEVIRAYSTAKIVLRAQNIEAQLWERIATGTSSFVKRSYLKYAARQLKWAEMIVLKKIDGLICLTEPDLDGFKALLPAITATVVPVGFDFNLNESKPANLPKTTLLKVYHLGSMDWLPNQEGVKWFITHVLPIISVNAPDLKIHLAGKKMPELFLKYQSPQLIVDGEVDNAIMYTADKSILMVPLLSGSGIRVKIIEALALGKVVVSTAIGASGIANKSLDFLQLKDEPEAFAAALIQYARQPEKVENLGKQAIEFARERFEIRKTGDEMVQFYQKLYEKEYTAQYPVVNSYGIANFAVK